MKVGLQPPFVYPWSDEVKAGIMAFRPDLVRVYPDLPEAEAEWLSNTYPNLIFLMRPLHDGKIDPVVDVATLEWHLKRLEPYLAGHRVLYEIANEPNAKDAYGPNGAGEFTVAAHKLLDFLEQRLPWVETVLLGLEVLGNDLEWARVLAESGIVARCKYANARSYWQHENYQSDEWAYRYSQLQKYYGDKAMIITEVGDSSSLDASRYTSSATRAARTLEVLSGLEKGGIEMACVFMPIPTPGWEYFSMTLGELEWFGEREGGIMPPQFVLGFKELAERLGAEVVGEPAMEAATIPTDSQDGLTFQITTKGIMIYTPDAPCMFLPGMTDPK